MPLYEYQCSQCGRRTEKRQKFSDAALTVCPFCAGPLKKLISAPAIQFKGGGWFADGYGNARSGASATASSEGGSSAAASDAGSGSGKSEASSGSSDSASSSVGASASSAAPSTAAASSSSASTSTPAASSTNK